MDILSFLGDQDRSGDILGILAQAYPDSVPYALPKAFITPEIILNIIPGMKVDLAGDLATIFNDLAPAYGLNSPSIFPAYFAQCAQESEYFTRFDERLGYSPARLVAIWPNRFPNIAAARPYSYNPIRLANNVYANRMGNGNELSGDGYKFRGGGGLMVTGQAMYEAYAKYKNSTPSIVADQIRKDLTMAIDSSMWVFAISKKLIDEAEAKDFESITKAINGGTNGEGVRKALYQKALAAMPQN